MYNMHIVKIIKSITAQKTGVLPPPPPSLAKSDIARVCAFLVQQSLTEQVVYWWLRTAYLVLGNLNSLSQVLQLIYVHVSH